MPFAPTPGQTCGNCKFYDGILAQCHFSPPPFGNCEPADGCNSWSVGTPTFLPKTADEPGHNPPDGSGYVA